MRIRSRALGYVVLWRDKKHKRYYLDYFWTSKNPMEFKGSGVTFRRALNRRPNDFRKRIIFTTKNREELFPQFKRYQQMIKSPDRYYNDDYHGPDKVGEYLNKQSERLKALWALAKKSQGS